MIRKEKSKKKRQFNKWEENDFPLKRKSKKTKDKYRHSRAWLEGID